MFLLLLNLFLCCFPLNSDDLMLFLKKKKKLERFLVERAHKNKGHGEMTSVF